MLLSSHKGEWEKSHNQKQYSSDVRVAPAKFNHIFLRGCKGAGQRPGSEIEPVRRVRHGFGRVEPTTAGRDLN